jgi:hypothetical protein
MDRMSRIVFSFFSSVIVIQKNISVRVNPKQLSRVNNATLLENLVKQYFSSRNSSREKESHTVCIPYEWSRTNVASSSLTVTCNKQWAFVSFSK